MLYKWLTGHDFRTFYSKTVYFIYTKIDLKISDTAAIKPTIAKKRMI
jgi:hypothetical protein